MVLNRNYSYKGPLYSVRHGLNIVGSFAGSFLTVQSLVKQRLTILYQNNFLQVWRGTKINLEKDVSQINVCQQSITNKPAVIVASFWCRDDKIQLAFVQSC
jgi:hypothetical protein